MQIVLLKGLCTQQRWAMNTFLKDDAKVEMNNDMKKRRMKGGKKKNCMANTP